MSSTLGDVKLDVLRAGLVAVIESASETAHYPQLHRAAFDDLDLPWLTLEYFDESELGALLDEPLEQRFAAVVLTPGAIALPGVRALLEQRTAVLAQALAHGVGIVITATTLAGLDRFDLAFLPEGGQVSLVDAGMREMAGTLVVDDLPKDEIDEDDGRRGCSAVTLAAGHAFGWTRSAVLHRPDGLAETVVWRAQFGPGRVIVSVLPFEWIGRRDLVAQALTRATRGRGVLVLGEQKAPPWYDDLAPGQFLARLPDPAGAPELLAAFSHLRLCPDVDWFALDGLDRPALLARLENDGTIEFPADGPGAVVYARLQGVPRYLTRLRQAQAALVDRIIDLPSSPTFHLLALALLADAAHQVVHGRVYVPDLLRKDTVAAIVTSAMTRRVRDGSVDGLLLPTANLLAACTICDIDDSAAVTMAAWIAMSAHQATDDQRAQARWALWAAGRTDLLGLVPEPEIEPASLLGQLACQLDDGQLEPLPDLPPAATPARDDGPAPDTASTGGDGAGRPQALSALDAALLAYTHARWGNTADPEPIWDALETTRRRTTGNGAGAAVNVEELCYRTAAQVLLDIHAPLAIHPEQAPPVEAVPHAATELLARQAEAETHNRHERQARDDLARLLGPARAMAGLLGALAILAGLALASIPLWLPAAHGLGAEVQLTLSAGIFVVVSTITTAALSTDTAQLVAPSWLRAIGNLVRRLRG